MHRPLFPLVLITTAIAACHFIPLAMSAMTTRPSIHLKSRSVATSDLNLDNQSNTNDNNNAMLSRLQLSADQQRVSSIIQFTYPVPHAHKLAAENALGRPLLDYVPDAAYVDVLTAEEVNALSNLVGEREIDVVVVPMLAEDKHDPNILKNIRLPNNVHRGERVALHVTPSRQIDAQTLADRLSDQCGGPQPFDAKSSRKVAVSVSADAAQSSIACIASDPDVLWVEEKGKSRFNNVHARAITHGYVDGQEEAVGRKVADDVTRNGLDGTGQTVAIGDSGMDWHRCSFFDAEIEAPAIWHLPNNTVEPKNHRKVAGYWALMDADDAFGGHGTHVSGSVAGHYLPGTPGYSDLSSHDGMASNAKVILTDIGCSTEGGCPCKSPGLCSVRCHDNVCANDFRETYEPDDLNENFFPWSYQQGARIHTNSWGEETDGEYRTSSQAIDQFTWDHKDFLPLFAAANDGDSGIYTMSTEGSSKNSLTVGASQTTNKGWVDQTDYIVWSEKLEQVRNTLKNAGFEDYAKVDSTDYCCQGGSIELCQALRGPKAEAGCLVDICCPAGVKETYSSDTVHWDSNSLATFSGRGPTNDGRIKPDIVAPGHAIVSTFGKETNKAVKCGAVSAHDELQPMSGTSMATPVTAGNVALIRQYYVDGLHPGTAVHGENGTRIGFSPSAALLKATIINGGVPLTGYVDINGAKNWKTLADLPDIRSTSVPSVYQGFGLLRLDRALQLDNSNFTLAVFNKEDTIAETGDKFDYYVKVNSPDEGFKATLVWTDYPSHPGAAFHLVNDLDLHVFTKDAHLFGNGLTKLSADGQSVNSVRDTRNNVEQINIQSPQAGCYKISVEAVNVPGGTGQQPFALVASGDLEIVSSCSLEGTGGDGDHLSVGAIIGIAVGMVVAFAVGLLVARLTSKSSNSPYTESLLNE